jgi:hypothetical protein
MDIWLILSLGTFWFWALIVVVSILILGFMEYEKGFWATVTLIGTVCLLHYFGGKQVFPWIAAHKLHTFYYVLA